MYNDVIPNPLYGLVRGTSRPNYSEGDQRTAILNGGETVVAQGLPLKSELVRLGQSWSITTPAANHFAPVAALPTTRAEMVLYNGEPSNGKSYLIDSVFAVADTSIAAAGVITLLGQMVASGTAPTDNTAVLVNSRSGRAAYGGRAKKAIANTAFGIADKWEVLGNSSSPLPPRPLASRRMPKSTAVSSSRLAACSWRI
jgi:hypothetical protein